MNVRTCLTFLALVVMAGLSWPQELVADQEKQAELKLAEKVLQDGNIRTDGPSLLQYLRQRAPDAQEQQRLLDLVQRLGDRSYRNRIQATSLLIKAGQQALPFLKEGLKADDPEVVKRAELCLQPIIEVESTEAPRIAAAVKLIAERKPEGSARVLLEVAPFVSDADVLDQIGAVLEHLVVQEGKPRPEVVAMLSDRFPIRRALAGEALAKAVGKRDDVMRLLTDPEPEVRLKVAAALVHARVPEAVPTLIDLIGRLSEERSWQAQDLLYRLAGDCLPDAALNKAASAEDLRRVWEKWWQQNHEKAPTLLANLRKEPHSHGYTLITQMGLQGGTNGQVFELGPDKKVRWKIEGLRYPVDAQVVGHNRVLLVEYLSNQVSERDFKGQIIWSKQVSLPTAIQRLPDGNTFIASRRMLLVLDREGKEVFTHRFTASISAAYRMRNGNMVVVTTGGVCMRLDSKGNQLSTFHAGPVYTMGGSIEVLPSGRILIPEYRNNRVTEYTPEGKPVWHAEVRFPTSATRLPNGNTLVVSMIEQRVVELNRNGTIVWDYHTDGRPWRARRR